MPLNTGRKIIERLYKYHVVTPKEHCGADTSKVGTSTTNRLLYKELLAIWVVCSKGFLLKHLNILVNHSTIREK